MATAASGSELRSVSIGRVLGRGFGTIGRNPVVTLGIAFAFGAVPFALLSYGVENFQPETFGTIGEFGGVAVAAAWLVISILLAMISQGALVRATVAHSEGRKAGFAESAMAGLGAAWPLFLVGLLSGLGIVAGLVLLIVPGIMLFIIWSVAAPALVEERLGPIEALGRSRELTRGARWTVFGLSLLILVIYWMFSGAAGIVALIWSGGSADVAAIASLEGSLGYLAFTTLIQTISTAVWGTILSALYIELRDWKDGPSTDRLADIFA
jgi:uncharacterized membrane protein